MPRRPRRATPHEPAPNVGFQIPGPTRGKVEHLMTMHGAERLPRASVPREED
jgi:hypothetical protein